MPAPPNAKFRLHLRPGEVLAEEHWDAPLPRIEEDWIVSSRDIEPKSQALNLHSSRERCCIPGIPRGNGAASHVQLNFIIL
jgi:hypothetical protein